MIVPGGLKIVATILAIHGWYDLECCGDRDCYPVDSGVVKELKEGVVVQGFGILSYSDRRLRWSKDDRDHICAARSGGGLICVYRRPKEF